jgi:hypothetical protein
MAAPIVRPTTAADIIALAGEPLPYQVRCVTIDLGGEPLGFGGIAYFPEHNLYLAFARLTERARKYPVALHKAGKRSLEIAREMGAEWVAATADPAVPASERWLERLGYQRGDLIPTGERVFLCHFCP